MHAPGERITSAPLALKKPQLCRVQSFACPSKTTNRQNTSRQHGLFYGIPEAGMPHNGLLCAPSPFRTSTRLFRFVYVFDGKVNVWAKRGVFKWACLCFWKFAWKCFFFLFFFSPLQSKSPVRWLLIPWFGTLQIISHQFVRSDRRPIHRLRTTLQSRDESSQSCQLNL